MARSARHALFRGSRHCVQALACIAATAGIVVATTGCAAPASHASAATDAAGRTFLQRYVAADGRVVRRDQGGDTVSEGQAYAMLIAVAQHDRTRFQVIWSWTQAHLQRPDHLLAFHWASGHVVDRNPAPDADLDAAIALLQAGRLFARPAWTAAGTAIANSVLTYETVTASPGALVVAGTWATADPATLNPSYVVSGEARLLARLTGNAGWTPVAAATASLDRSLAARFPLPPDWATLAGDAQAGDATATGAPDGSQPVQYGLDAPRLIIRLAASCSASDRALAATYARRLGAPGAVGERTLSGAPLVTWRHPLTDVALYAARTAAGDRRGAATALAAAAAQDRHYPTYYGAAWLALAPELFGSLKETC
ncbi:glycosyl hydrolase family 8 [uncultured Jatrophihabitans sp.]|uniref:glycosyl hydrolase family 8 n=1 Tax=uncultured Jatrophihabitans sp. TaxID=1610747 RepID=UPI0035CC0D93